MEGEASPLVGCVACVVVLAVDGPRTQSSVQTKKLCPWAEQEEELPDFDEEEEEPRQELSLIHI